MKADYIMVGGFLGAGKTTALLRLAEHLKGEGRRVGLITNDQSTGLVDTALVGSHGFPVEEITGGCFCCRFDSLTEAARRLTEASRPDVFLAEPVGSCTDLRASVQYPLRRLYGENYRIAPLSVLVDPVRAMRILGLEPGKAFSPKVLYIYDKQLEEADIIVINKSDLMEPARLARLEHAFRERYPATTLYRVSARTGGGLEGWFAEVARAEFRDRGDLALDYDIYADGEALLGWFNATFRIEAESAFDGNRLLRDLAARLGNRLTASGHEIAHFKAFLTPDDHIGDLGVLNMVGGDREPEQSHRLEEAMTSGELIVNLRAEGDPDLLRRSVLETLGTVASRAGAGVETAHMEHFRPSRPNPTHRMPSGVD